VYRRIRDVVVTLVAVGVLFALLMAVNPQVRERMGQMSGAVETQQWNSPEGPVGSLVQTAVVTASNYAYDNPVLFPFVAVAAVLFVLMLRT
jgi:hypothetical protein